jgi:hypothetical protein
MELMPDRAQLEIFIDALFRHAFPAAVIAKEERDEDQYVSLRIFLDNSQGPPIGRVGVPLIAGVKALVDRAESGATKAANHDRPAVFAPPVAVFNSREDAKESDLVYGVAISAECDQHPQQARQKLEAILGPATVVVKSGGVWVNGGDAPEDKLHLHWRLKQLAFGAAELTKLKQARTLACAIIGGDPTNNPIVHPIRWPGS